MLEAIQSIDPIKYEVQKQVSLPKPLKVCFCTLFQKKIASFSEEQDHRKKLDNFKFSLQT